MDSIIFRSKNSYVTVLVDGVEVYKTDITNSMFYNHSPGTRWNMFSFSNGDAGKIVELRIQMAYEDGRSKVDNIYMGDRAAILLNIIQSKSFGLLICVMIIGVGIIYMIATLVLNRKRKNKDYSLLYLSIFAIVAGGWCFLETNILQLFSNNLRLLQVIDNMLLAVGVMPLYLYIDCIYGIFKKLIIKIVAVVDLLYMIFATISQVLGWLDENSITVCRYLVYHSLHWLWQVIWLDI